MWYKRERKAGCQLHPLVSTNTHTLNRQTISQPPHCFPLALEGAQRPPHLSPRPTTDLAAASRPSRSHESSSINVNHQAFPCCFYHSTPLLWGLPSSSVQGPLSFTHWPQLRFLSTVGWSKPKLLCMVSENWQGINTSVQTQTLLTCKCCEAVLQRFWTQRTADFALWRTGAWNGFHVPPHLHLCWAVAKGLSSPGFLRLRGTALKQKKKGVVVVEVRGVGWIRG